MSVNHDDDKTQSFTPLTTDTLIGHYRIIEKIGAGGMGEVYLAEDTELKRQVALKFLPYQFLSDENAKARFKREAQAAAKLNHPNIVTIYEVSEYQNRPFFAMECCDGRLLRNIIKEKELSIDESVNLAIQICEGLDKAHNAGIVHRDIKPSNIIVDSDGRPKLLDFGLATFQGTEKLTQTGSTLGTIGYMSPEQVNGEKVDTRSDLFSVGVILYEMIAGKRPFQAEYEAATMNAILHDTPEPLSRYKSKVPEQLQQIVTKLLEKNVSYRYQSAAGVLSDLRRLSSKSLQARRPIDKWNRYVVPSAVLLLLAVLAVWYFAIRTGQVSKSDGRIGLVVLPFENLGTQEDAYFADGMTDEITAKLAGIGGLRVISRTSAVHYKGSDKPLKDIAEELNVDYVLEGTIRWDKSSNVDRIRIIPQLIRAFDDSHIWATTLERELTQVFAVQADIAEQVATALNVNLLGEDKHRLQQIPTTNMEAYDYYLRGREIYHVAAGIHENLELAISMFEKAVALDTAFVSAYAELSRMHSFVYWFGWDRSKERSNGAGSNSQRALALDSNNTLAHIASGFYYYYIKRDFDKALSEFEYARKITADDADVLTAISAIKRRQGYWKETYQSGLRALELDPLFTMTRHGMLTTASYMRRFDDAERIATKGLELFPDDIRYSIVLGHIFVARDGDASRGLRLLDSQAAGGMRFKNYELYGRWWYNYLQRRYEEALEPILEYVHYCQTAEDTADYLFSVAETYHLLNRTAASRAYYDSARVYIEALNARSMALGAYLPPSLGLVYSRLGRNEEAIHAARRDSARVPLSDDAFLGTEPLVDLAVTYARVGEPDKALDLIDTLLSVPSDLTVAKLKLDPIYDPLRDHPRFQALIEKYERKNGI